jgi:hypothetical protein
VGEVDLEDAGDDGDTHGYPTQAGEGLSAGNKESSIGFCPTQGANKHGQGDHSPNPNSSGDQV